MFFGILIAAMSRYKRCPSDKILVIYGKTGNDPEGHAKTARCIHGGAAFVWPVFQDYQFLELTPIPIDIDLRSALSKQNIRINVPSSFTVAISTQGVVMQNAAERLLGLFHDHIKSIAEDIIFGQLRLTIATMDIEEINTDRDKFLINVSENVEIELKKVGLQLINVNIKDITDESGYIEALGKEAAAQAINEAKKKVAEKERDGSIGQAEAQREQRIKVSAANAAAVDGENTAAVSIANSQSSRQINEAEAIKLSSAAEKVQAAKALEESYEAERIAETKRAERDKATQYANDIVKAEIERERVRIEADAAAENQRARTTLYEDTLEIAAIEQKQIEIAANAQADKVRIEAKGRGDATFAEMEGKARGMYEQLAKQAEGLQKIVSAAGNNVDKAAMLMITEQMPELAKIQVEAVKGIKIDNVTVWDTMSGGTGTPTTANFLSGMLNVLPQYKDIFKMVGMNLPEYFGKPIEPGDEKTDAPAPDAAISEDDEF
jgi:flotillin